VGDREGGEEAGSRTETQSREGEQVTTRHDTNGETEWWVPWKG
jgi:hypothetical protein